ncbi:GumC family protein [Rhizobium sp. BK251]|uniref:GumC family protein n=1 Tax=Rhizobium sp. BK251 TaxID=2512125 RepID=UPI001053F81E|nr:GumC family protein [Rhizobium sp. BK251]TCL72032.1 uncharacterized protein involved in exopolysaccharide biosynthesis [Rhizobium sp. BK251]
MSSYDRNRVSRLPNWRSNEPHSPAVEGVRPRGPVVSPAEFMALRKPRAAAVSPVPEPAAEIIEEQETRVRQDEVKVTAPDVPEPQTEEPAREVPLLDIRSAVQAIWQRRRLIVVLAAIGAVLGAVLLPSLPRKYTAETSLYFNPRLGSTGDASQAAASPELITSMIDSQVQILVSGNVMRRVADALKLSQDPAFGNAGPSVATAALQKAVSVARESNTYVVSLKVTTNDPAKSARIANQIVSSFVEEEGAASSDIYKTTSTALDGRLDELRLRVQEAEQAVENFRAENDMATADGNLISDQRLSSLNELLVTAQSRTIQAKARADAASNLSFETVVAGAQPEGSVSSTLANLRQQYASLAATVGSLESQLGSRHPRLLAARSSLESLAGEIRSELRRQASSARADYEQARKAEEAIGKELAVQKAQQANGSDRLIELKELERKAAAAREIYESVMKRSGETSEEQNVAQSNIRVISKAEPPIKADGAGGKVLMVAGLVGGFGFGLAIGAFIAILAGLSTHPLIRSYLRRPSA